MLRDVDIGYVIFGDVLEHLFLAIFKQITLVRLKIAL